MEALIACMIIGFVIGFGLAIAKVLFQLIAKHFGLVIIGCALFFYADSQGWFSENFEKPSSTAGMSYDEAKFIFGGDSNFVESPYMKSNRFSEMMDVAKNANELDYLFENPLWPQKEYDEYMKSRTETY